MELADLHKLAKQALRGDTNSLLYLLSMLKFLGVPALKVVAYLLVYQYIMNKDPEAGELCRTCGGRCCQYGPEVPLYPFDFEDLEAANPNWRAHVSCNDGSCYIMRPCPFQRGWECTIHSFKPYACLSYPFASEDVQTKVLMQPPTRLPPEPVIPSFCLAAVRVWEKIKDRIKRFEGEGRVPEPEDLLGALS